MKLDQQCGVCRSYTWCGRPCRQSPTIYESPGLAEEPVDAASHDMAFVKAVKKANFEAIEKRAKGRAQEATEPTEKPVQAVSKRKAPKVAKAKEPPVKASPDSAKAFDRKTYQREYMMRRRAEAKAKSQ